MEKQPIETAPRDGTPFLALNGEGWFITSYRPQFVGGSGFGVIHSCCGYYEDMAPSHWVPLPQT